MQTVDERLCRWLPVALVLSTTGVICCAAPTPRRAWHDLTAPVAADLTRPVVAAATLLAELLVAWLVLTALLTAGGQLRGPLGRLSDGLASCVAPAVVRRGVAVALGIGVALGTAGTASAAPARPAAATQAVAPLDWPLAQLPTSAPVPSPTTDVVVRPGDTLWALAAQELPPGATAQQVAARWPAWWSANRDVLGDDPGLLHPGQHLRPPAA